jgi:Glycosyl hydrolase family 20, catalytic domain/beta-acetyl hexosaminidase like
MRSDAASLCFYTACAVAAWSRPFFALAEPAVHRLWNDSLVWPAPQIEVYEVMRTFNNSIPILRTLYVNDLNWEYNEAQDVPTKEAHSSVWVSILDAARDRFQLFLGRAVPSDIDPSAFDKYYPVNPSNAELVQLAGIRLNIRNTSETNLYFGLDESYEIDITDPSKENSSWIEISSTNVYGSLYGLESLKQLLQFGWLQSSVNHKAVASTAVFILRNSTFKLYISDTPVYSYRGIMIDTARHFLPLDDIVINLQVMASNKLNVLHWHMTDSQSFPYLSERFPELAIQGAYCYPECVYNASQIKLVINQASLLGIRVIVEVDLPGHSQGTRNRGPSKQTL